MSSTIERTAMATIATKVWGALRKVSTAKNTSTIAVATIPSRTIHACAPVSPRNRSPERPTRRKIMSEHALPTDAIAERSTRFETTSTMPAVTRIPACGPSGELLPKNVGNWRASASIDVRPPAA
jgi:hypothetical protein